MRNRQKGVIGWLCAVTLATSAVFAVNDSWRAVSVAAIETYGDRTGMAPPPGACGNPDPAVVAAAMTQVVATGINKIRCDLSWWTVQPYNATTWDWTNFDNVVQIAAYFGVEVLFVPGYTPPWARPNPIPAGTIDPSHVPPVRYLHYAYFVYEAAQRYSPNGANRPAGFVGSVTKWEIWNEPNIVGFWNPVNPVRYSVFLAASAAIIHWIEPTATVISGGLAPAGNVNGNLAPDTFTYVLALTGALQAVDGVGIHPYTFPAYPSEKINFNPLVNHIPRMYNVMKQFSAGSKKIWVTEAGWPTSSQSPETTRFDGSQVGTEPIQALALWDLLTTWNRYSYAGPMYLYAQMDKCSNVKSWFCMMGLQRVDGTQKPAYGVVKSMMAMPIN